MKKLTLIIPCYNEEAALPFFYKSVKETSLYENTGVERDKPRKRETQIW